jgi:acyl-CoA synthetase (NDP forming)/GNAT superfamily N-acetyltransferase
MTRIILRDGKVAELRRAKKDAEDHALVKALFNRASADSLYFRFFHTVREVSDSVIDDMLGGNGKDQLSLLCLAGDKALGIGTYVRVSEDTAEVAFLVDDELHGKGFGTLLLEHLAQEAWHYGFKQFEAFVIDGNYKMLQVFRSSGYELRQTSETGNMHLVLPLTHTDRVRSLRASREKLATQASLTPFFTPKSVAVIGASRDPHGLGHLVFRNILNGGFQGTVYPVNPSAQTVASVRAYATLKDLPEPIDLAVIVVPASEVLDVVDQCVEAQVGAVMILSAGFAERGAEGAQLQQEVVRRLRHGGCRLIGPNSLGLVNTVSDVQLNASFASHIPSTQGLSIASQSGALGIAILEYASRIGVGVTHFVSMGNKADVSSNDLIQYWEDDPATRLIALYIESFGNPRKFSRLARRITRKKPILVVKGAQSPLTRSISGTATMPSSASEGVVDALFQQTGVIRLDTLQEMFDVAALLANQPLPRGRRVAIVTNSAGGAVITADALLKEHLNFVHPVIDLGFNALAEGYREVLPQVLRDDTVDTVVVLYVPVGVSDQDAIVTAIAEAVDEVASEGIEHKPIVANFLTTGDYLVHYIHTKTQRIPVYPFPEQAVRALAKVNAYADYLARDRGHIPDLAGADAEHARAIVRKFLTGGPLPAEVCDDVLVAMGVENTELAAPEVRAKVRIDITPDPLFGPVMRVARYFEGMADDDTLPLQSVLRITPLTNVDASGAVEHVAEWFRVKADPELTGLTDLLLRLSLLVEEVPEITEVTLPCVEIGGAGYHFEQIAIHVADEE